MTGANFSSWYQAGDSTFAASGSFLALGSNATPYRNALMGISDGTVANSFAFGKSVSGFPADTPAAFSKPGQTKKKNNRLASVTGGTVVNNLEEGEKAWALGDVPASKDEALPMKPTAAKEVDKAKVADISGMIVAENRWLELKREESSPRAKVGRGVSNIHKQLSEIEKFVNWYSKIKTENGLKKEDYWKRTNASLYKIRERLMGITEKLRTL
jgi:hypothetical protein